MKEEVEQALAEAVPVAEGVDAPVRLGVEEEVLEWVPEKLALGELLVLAEPEKVGERVVVRVAVEERVGDPVPRETVAVEEGVACREPMRVLVPEKVSELECVGVGEVVVLPTRS